MLIMLSLTLSLTSRLYESWVELFLRNVWPACWVWEFIRPLSCQQDGYTCDCAGQQTAPCPSVQPVFLAWWKIQGQEFGKQRLPWQKCQHTWQLNHLPIAPNSASNRTTVEHHDTLPPPILRNRHQNKITTNNVFENIKHCCLEVWSSNAKHLDARYTAGSSWWSGASAKALRHLIKPVWMPNLRCI